MPDPRKKIQNKRTGFMTKFMLRRSASRHVDGLWIGSFEDGPESGLRRVEEALNLVKTYDPRRYARLLHDLERVWVLMIPSGRAAFDPEIWACVLDPRFVLDKASSPELIAAAIVHEATHARLWHCGFGYEEEVRAKVRKGLHPAWLAFAAKLPSGQSVRARPEQKLAIHRGYGPTQMLRNGTGVVSFKLCAILILRNGCCEPADASRRAHDLDPRPCAS